MTLNAEEQRALDATEKFFREPGESLLGRASRAVFRPVEALTERLVPDRVLELAGGGVEGVLKGIATISDKTLDLGGVLREARKHAEVDRIEELKDQPLKVVDTIAEASTSQGQLLAALEGAGCGAGGVALLAADIPLLFGVCMRTVRHIGACYGVDPELPGEDVIAFKVFELACGGTQDRYAELLEIDTLADELDGLEQSQRAEKAAVLAGLFMSREAIKKIVSMLISRKVFQTIPLAGALVGAGFNYLFVADVAKTASMVYRRRYLYARAKVRS
ncbi:MAG: EcsC family protein [Planctomycetes bacterium]|nr:EcsC family protein [Planctomycetota bacterium]